jgi:bacterioferritin
MAHAHERKRQDSHSHRWRAACIVIAEKRFRFPSETDMITETTTTREQLIEDLNGDLAREYQAVIAYVVYSQVLKGAEYMAIAKELEVHATEELQHALIVAKQIDYLGGVPTVEQEPVKMSSDPVELIRFDLDNEVETIRNYRQRVRQAEALGEYAIAEQIREILVQEQEHLIDLSTALGEDAPKITDGETV